MEYRPLSPRRPLEVRELYTVHYFEYSGSYAFSGERHDFWELLYVDKGMVSVTAGELFCRINVSDTGPGIPEAERPLVFQRFYRSPAAYETEGVGIGLYLARQIAEGQGGYIKVSSRPGQGSCFSLYLPRS